MNHLLFASVFLAQVTEPVGVPGWVPVVIAVILLLLFWWGLNRNSIPQGSATHEDDHHDDDHAPQTRNEPHAIHVEPDVAPLPVETDPVVAEPTAADTDDLKIIEGIGPKIEGVLHNAGIRTFTELASASVSQLEKIVREEAGIQIAFPDTWPEQAQLASAQKWSELEKLQDDLKGGRRE